MQASGCSARTRLGCSSLAAGQPRRGSTSRPDRVALLSQSGNVVVAMYEQARQAGIGFSACVGVGDQVMSA